MLRTALTLSAAAMLMLSTSQGARTQGYLESQRDSYPQASQDSMPTSEPYDTAATAQHEEGVIEPKPGESAVEDPHGLDAADELARSMPLHDAEKPDASLAMTEDLDDPDRLAQASPPEPDLMQQEILDEDQTTDANPSASDANGDANELEGHDLGPSPAPANQ